MENLRIRMFQLRPREKEYNIKRMINLIKEGGFNVGIFPELYISGYLLRDDINLNKVTDEDIKLIQDNLENDMMIIVGGPEYDRFLYNSAYIILKDKFSTYRKMFLPNFGPFEERRYFMEGTKPFFTEFMGFILNVEICYDLFFDSPLVNGSDIIVNISASPFTSRPYFEKVFPSISIKKQSYMIYVNTSGLQRNLIFWGGSRIVNPDGNIVLQFPYFKEFIGDSIISREEIERSRIKRRVIRDEILHEIH